MFKDISPGAKAGTVQKARRLRASMSLPEVLLWAALRRRPGGLKWRRQHPSGRYIIDFYCSDARLAVEIDGEAHDRGSRPTMDEERDHWFAATEIVTLRIPAAEVLNDLDAAVRFVTAEALTRLPLHHPAAPGGPPPPDKLGED